MQNDTPDWLTEIDHTGDIGLQIRASSLEALYARAAVGMFRVLTDIDAVQGRASTAVEVTAPDREALMVRWLSELNFIHTTQHWLFCRFDVALTPGDEGDLRLQATGHGERIDRARHTVFTEIKAVTFHGMEIRETDDGWTVQVIFDM